MMKPEMLRWLTISEQMAADRGAGVQNQSDFARREAPI